MKYYAVLKTLKAGYEHEKQYVAETIFPNQKYEIEEMYIHDYHTEVYLKGFGKPFNSVFFNFFDEDGIEYNYLSVPIAVHLYR